MKTLILFSSKYGHTRKIAEQIAVKLQGDAISIEDADTQMLEAAEKVIIGTAIYAGRPYGKTAKCCKKHLDILLKKDIGLFVSGLIDTDEKREVEFATAFPEALRKKARAHAFVGGGITYSKLNFLEKKIIKALLKTEKDVDNVDHEAIDAFVKAMAS